MDDGAVMKTLPLCLVVLLCLLPGALFAERVILLPVTVAPECACASKGVEKAVVEVLSPFVEVVAGRAELSGELLLCRNASSSLGCLEIIGRYFEAEVALGVAIFGIKNPTIRVEAMDLRSGHRFYEKETPLSDFNAPGLGEAVAMHLGQAMEVLPGLWFVRLSMPGPPRFIQVGEVSQSLWARFMGGNPSHFVDCGDACPVESVSLTSIEAFLFRINTLGVGHFRLPTIKEWRVAATVQGEGQNASGVSCVSYQGYPCDQWPENFSGCAWCGPRPLKAGWRPGPVNLHGNVREWVVGPGGAFLAGASWAGSGTTRGSTSGYVSDDAGFRMVFSLEEGRGQARLSP